MGNYTGATALAALKAILEGIYVQQVTGKGLSTNDYTTAEKTKLASTPTSFFDGAYASLTGKPDLTGYQTSTQVASAIQTAIANLASKSDVASAVANFVTSAQVQTAIAAALNTSGFQSASQVNALIAAALADLDVDTEIFVTVSELPDADAADTNKIYIQTTDMTEWRSTGTAWDALGGVSLDLEGYYNEDNFTEITAEELQDIWDEA